MGVQTLFILSFFLTGILVLIDRGFLNKTAKIFLVLTALVMAFFSALTNDSTSFFIGVAAAFVAGFCPLRNNNSKINTKLILEDILNGSQYKIVYQKEIKKSKGRKWLGSAGFLMFLFLFILYYNTHVLVSKIPEKADVFSHKFNYKEFYDSLPFYRSFSYMDD